MHGNFALTVNHLSKTYADGTIALRDVSFKVPEGDFFGLLGPNGAGKTTILEIISSVTNKSSGTISIGGIDVDKDFPNAKAKLGVVPQEFNCNIFETPLQIILKQAGFYGISSSKARPRAKFLLEKLELWHKRDVPCRSLSGGMKRRLMIARGLIHQPSLLMLDEPTAGVDVELRRGMLEFIKEINQQGTTVILTTHYLEEAEQLCKNVAIVGQGKIVVEATVKELVKTLDTETFILNLDHDIQDLPQVKNYNLRLIDNSTISADVLKDQSLNPLFAELTSHNINVVSLKNKANRLEEYFLKITEKKG